MVIELPSKSHQARDSSRDSPVFEDISAGALPPPSTSTPQLQKWNSPRLNMWRCLATFYSFTILGANDAAYGALIPYLETWYRVNYTVISLIFLSPIVGYTMSALLNNRIHTVYGQRGVAWIMSMSHLLAYSKVALPSLSSAMANALMQLPSVSILLTLSWWWFSSLPGSEMAWVTVVGMWPPYPSSSHAY